MSISFSGLASGLDTSSWVESLAALKRAKVTTLEEQKEAALLTKETLNNIRSFFNSFRSTLEKITDTKFNVNNMNLFAQNLATSSNLSVLTATATPEAEEATYNIEVDKLAKNTEATSRYTYFTTIEQTTVATKDSKLKDIGINAGKIGVTVNDTEHEISITDSDTIATFINKLKNIGVEAGYNESTGIFSVNLNAGDINDIDSTGIVDALHLQGVNEGYKTDTLIVSKTETLYSNATSDTMLTELGVFIDDVNTSNNQLTIKANNVTTVIELNENTTMGDLLTSLSNKSIAASFADGIFILSDAEILGEGTTNFVNALGLTEDIYEKTQISNPLKTLTVTTINSGVTGTTKLGEIISSLETESAVSSGYNLSFDGQSVSVSAETTINQLISTITALGGTAELDSNSCLQVDGGTLSGSVASALGITSVTSTNSVSETGHTLLVSSTAFATSTTKLSDLGMSGSITYSVHIAETSEIQAKTINASTTTIGDFLNSLSPYNITGTIENGIVSLSSDAGNYISGELADILGIGCSVTTVVSNQTSTSPVKYSGTVFANGSTSLGDLGAVTNTENTIEIYDEVNSIVGTITLTTSSTIDDMFEQLALFGINGTISSANGVITLTSTEGNYATGTVMDNLGIGLANGGNTTTTVSKSMTSSSVITYNSSVTATASTTISSCVTLPLDTTIQIYDKDNNWVGTVSITSTTTFSTLIADLQNYGITGSMSDGKLTLTSEDGFYGTGDLLESLGITVTSSTITVTQGATATSDEAITLNYTVAATTTDLIYDALSFNPEFNSSTVDRTISIYNSENTCVGTITIEPATSFASLFTDLQTYGITGSITGDGVIQLTSEDGSYVTGEIINLLGITTNTTTTTTTIGATVNSTLQVTYLEPVTASASTTFGELTPTQIANGNNVIQIKYSEHDGTTNLVSTTYTITSETTVQNFIDKLATYGMDAKIENGIITISTGLNRGAIVSDKTGEGILSALGLTATNHTLSTLNSNYSTTAITYTESHIATGTTTLEELGLKHVRVSETEATAQGYTCVHTKAELEAAINNNENIMLMNDITYSGTIGPAHSYSNAILDGNGYSLIFNNCEAYHGYFSVISNATIQNLTIDGYKIVKEPYSMNPYNGNLGILSERLDGGNITIDNVTIKNSSIAERNGDTINYGLLAGDVSGSNINIRNCYVQGQLNFSATVSATSTVGGLVGKVGYVSDFNIENCAVNAEITTYYHWYNDNIGTFIGNAGNMGVDISNSTWCGKASNMGGCLYLVGGRASNVNVSGLKLASALTNVLAGVSTQPSYQLGNEFLGSGEDLVLHHYDSIKIIDTSGITTIDDLFSTLSSNGINCSISNGTITLTSVDNAYYITGNFADKLGIGVHYVENNTIIAKTIASSAVIKHTDNTTSMSSASTLADLGLEGSYTVTVSKSGTVSYLTFTSTNTMSEFCTALRTATGAQTLITASRFRFAGTSSSGCIIGMTQELADTLKIKVGEGSSYSIKTTTTTVNTDSLQITYQSQSVAINGTTMSELGISSQQYITLQHTNGSYSTITVKTTDTMGSVVSKATAAGIDISFNNGYLEYAAFGEDIQSVTLSASLQDAFKMGAYSTTSVGKVYSSGLVEKNVTVTMSGSSTIGDISGNDSEAISLVHNGIESVIEFNSTATVDDMCAMLATYGITGNVANGKLTLTPADGSYIKGISNGLYSALNLGFGGGVGVPNEYQNGTYTYVQIENGTSTTNSYSNSNSSAQSVIETTTAGGQTTLSELGINSTLSNAIVINNSGVSTPIEITSDMTIDALIQKLNTEGNISASFSNGKLTLAAGAGGSYVESLSDTFRNAFKITSATSSEIEKTVHSNSQSSTLYHDVTYNATNSTKLSTLGLSTTAYITVMQNGTTECTVTVSSTDTLSTLFSKLGEVGITGTISGGKTTLNPDSADTYITGMSSTLANALNLTGKSGYDVITTTGSVNTGSTAQTIVRNDLTLTTAVVLSTIAGFDNGNGTIEITKSDGTTVSVSINPNDTLADFFVSIRNLSDREISGTIDASGTVTITGAGNAHLSSVSGGSNILEALNLGTINYEINSSNTNSSALNVTTTAKATTSSRLGDLNGISYDSDGKLRLVVETDDGLGSPSSSTITFTSTSTLADVKSTLNSYGITLNLNNTTGVISAVSNSAFNIKSDDTKSGSFAEFLGFNSGNQSIDTNTTNSSTILTNITISSVEAAATWDTKLSDLGVTNGEYLIYSNGTKYTATVSSGTTLGSIKAALTSVGISMTLDTSGNTATVTILGSGNSYIASSPSNASNIVNKLFTNPVSETKKYQNETALQTCTISVTADYINEDTYVRDIQYSMESIAGDLIFSVNGQQKSIHIDENEQLRSVLQKFSACGIEASIVDGQIILQSGFNTFSISNASTSSLGNSAADTGLQYCSDFGGYLASSQVIEATTSIEEERSASVANYAGMKTTLSMLNITNGILSVYRNGEKAEITINEQDTFNQLNKKINDVFSDVSLSFEDGHLKIASNTEGVNIRVGSTTDKGNFISLMGLENSDKDYVIGARQLYCVNADSLVTEEGLFRGGQVREGSFIIGTEKFEITSTTKLSDLISQINAREGANATAYWDSVDGKLVIKSRSTGASFINIEVGKSNFTDIMGFTTSEWTNDANHELLSTKMNIDTQTLGDNAQVKINGTTYVSTSNRIDSDVSRIKGLTLDLKGLTEGSVVTVTVKKDHQSLTNALDDIVDAYNVLMENVDKEIASTGALHDQTTLKMIRNQLRTLMTSSANGTSKLKNLDAIGISTASASTGNISTSNDRIVSLAFDTEKFMKAYSEDADSVKTLLVGVDNESGLFNKIESVLESSLQAVTGYFASTEKSLSDKVSTLNRKIIKANKSVERYRSYLSNKFSAMDLMISKMQQQYSSFLS